MIRSCARTATLAATFATLGLGGSVAETTAPTTLTGTIKVVCTIVTDASLPNGSAINLAAAARGSGLNAYQIANASTTLTKTSNSQRVVLTLPYKWMLNSQQPLVPITLSANSGTYPSISYVSVTVTVPPPGDGSVTVISIPVRM